MDISNPDHIENPPSEQPKEIARTKSNSSLTHAHPLAFLVFGVALIVIAAIVMSLGTLFVS